MIFLNKTRKKINIIFDIACLILSLGIPLNFSYPFIVLLFILLRMITSNKDTNGLYLCLFGAVIGGMVRALYPFIPIYGLLVVFIGLVFLREYVKDAITQNYIGLSCFIVVLTFFIVYYYVGPKTEFATDKLTSILSNGILFYISYLCFCKSKTIQNRVITHLLLLTTIFYFVASQNLESIGSPKSIIDFAWYRDHYGFNTRMVFYQIIGMNALFAMAFIFGKKGCRFFTIPNACVLLTGLYLILMSGARQAVLGVLILVPLSLLFQNQVTSTFMKFNRTILVIISILVLFLFLEWMEIPYFSDFFSHSSYSLEDRLNREINYAEAYMIIEKYSMEGTGLGGYNYITKNPYPHNFFLEILCECGIIGLIALILIISFFIYKTSLNWYLLTKNQIYFFVVFFCVILRTMVSGDFTFSICVFSALFATSIKYEHNDLKSHKKEKSNIKYIILKSYRRWNK